MSNRLKNETSPYLLQHCENPVQWYPWGEEAFKKAEKEDKPVFLSVGYSTCHWCHVMAHESFENEEIAKLLNKYFVSIKVDREERPDIDSVYMAVCQAFTGRGGWPMSIFMTAGQKPFFAGTYFPPKSRYGIMGFEELIITIAKRWESNREALLVSADDISRQLNTNYENCCNDVNQELPELAVNLFKESFDSKYGGFGEAPKFPTPHNLVFLMLYSKIKQDKSALEEVEITLDSMRKGGIFDQIGYGFSRYSTDRYFLVPHFEKMLYDNALLIIAYLTAYKMTSKQKYLDTAEKTAEYILREMTDKDGGFYSAQDADSDGEEGKFYIWTYEEICSILGNEKGEKFCDYFGVTKQGNFQGKNILNLLNGNDMQEDFEEEIKLLYQRRNVRGKLHIDDKILTSWNSLMISAFAMLYRVTGTKKYLLAAERANNNIEKRLMAQNDLYVGYRNGKCSVKGFLNDYAYYAMAQIFLYDAVLEEKYLKCAIKICEEAENQFADRIVGGYFLYGKENDTLISRPKETYDGAVPSGNSAIAYCLVRLSQITDCEAYQKRAERQLVFMSGEAAKYPAGYSMFLIAQLLYLYPGKRITVVLSKDDSVMDISKKLPFYSNVKVLKEETGEYKLLNGKTTYYVCEDYTCLPPTNIL